MIYYILAILIVCIILILWRKQRDGFTDSSKPIVSVIIPNYNNQTYIKDTIDSVLNQTYKHYEIIIIDDKSTDNSASIIQNIAKKYPNKIKFIQNKRNLGTYKSLNKGLKYMTGDYFTILGSDDTFHKDRLLEDVTMLTNTDKLATISKYTRVNHLNKLISSPAYGESMLTCHKSVIQKIGPWLNCRFGADTEYLNRLELLLNKNSIAYNNKVLYYAIHKQNNENLTKIYKKDKRKIIVIYFKKLHNYYNTRINKTQYQELLNMIPYININKKDHLTNLKILKIKY